MRGRPPRYVPKPTKALPGEAGEPASSRADRGLDGDKWQLNRKTSAMDGPIASSSS